MCDKRPLTQGREATYITPNSQLAEWSVASGKHSETLDRDTSKTPKAHLYVTDVWAMLCGDPGSIPQIVAHQLRARQTQSKCCAVGIDTCNRVIVMQAVAETRCGGGIRGPCGAFRAAGPERVVCPARIALTPIGYTQRMIRLREAEPWLIEFSQTGD